MVSSLFWSCFLDLRVSGAALGPVPSWGPLPGFHGLFTFKLESTPSVRSRFRWGSVPGFRPRACAEEKHGARSVGEGMIEGGAGDHGDATTKEGRQEG